MTPTEPVYLLTRAMAPEMPAEDDPEHEPGTPRAKRTRFVMSTAESDRYDDIIEQSTWKLDNFRLNPVVPWGHNHDLPPVGKCLAIGVVEGKLSGTIEWDTGEHNALGQLVAEQYATGFLSAVSVGFRPGRGIRRSQLDKADPAYKEAGYGMIYYDCELLEVSAVVVPANAGALAAKGLPLPRLTAPELRAELLRLLREDPAIRGELSCVVESAISDSAKLREARVMRSVFGSKR